MDQTACTYRALDTAAHRIGFNNYRAQLAAHRKAGRGLKTFRFTVTEAHKSVVDAMPALLGGEMSPEEAINLLHGYDVLKQRVTS